MPCARYNLNPLVNIIRPVRIDKRTGVAEPGPVVRLYTPICRNNKKGGGHHPPRFFRDGAGFCFVFSGDLIFEKTLRV
jgi:hypothetical protein